MYDEGLNREEEKRTNRLVDRFELMIVNENIIYFDSEELELIIDHYSIRNNTQRLEKVFHLSEKLFPFSIDIKIKKAQILIANNHPKKALHILNELSSLAQNNDDYFFTLAVTYSKLGKHDEAITILEKLLNSDNKNEELLSTLANEYQYIEDNDSSIKILQKLIKIDASNEIYWYSYILSSSLVKNTNPAIKFIKDYISSNPYSYLAWHYLGLTFLKSEDHLNAIEAFDYAILIDEKSTKSYIYKAESLAALGLYDHAIETCKLTFEFEDPHAALYYDIGEFYEKSDKLDKALAYFHKALKKDSDMSDAWFSIALILDFQGKLVEASYHIKKAVEKNNTNIDYLFSFAEIHEKLGFIKEAEIAYKKVTDIDNYDSESWLNYSNLLYKQKYQQEAVDALYDALKINPNNAELHYRLSAYLIDSGDETKGLSFFKNALEIDFDQHEDVFKYMPSVKENKNLLHLLHNFKN